MILDILRTFATKYGLPCGFPESLEAQIKSDPSIPKHALDSPLGDALREQLLSGASEEIAWAVHDLAFDREDTDDGVADIIRYVVTEWIKKLCNPSPDSSPATAQA